MSYSNDVALPRAEPQSYANLMPGCGPGRQGLTCDSDFADLVSFDIISTSTTRGLMGQLNVGVPAV